ncbi:MAG TPA: GDSL-type esterase/lipase family protein [Candidatus Limnocylindria bacterium]|nr:GDSL-type esterase/lipase family protein [Candidatus Limnocylindria bacterium]
MRYVALGDSYTIGTSVRAKDRWPDQLVRRLPSLELIANPAVNGFTSADLIEHELPGLAAWRPELVTVLIGVNDVVRGVDEDEYARNVDVILDRLTERVGASRVVAVAIPDYTVTPRGGDYGDPTERRAAIGSFNAIMAAGCGRRAVAFVADTWEISRRAGEDPSLVAEDGLHPSGAQYRLWVDAIAPVVARLLGD